jgi:aryl-alcohol dehydrogenase-like predicted oxidoreductase
MRQCGNLKICQFEKYIGVLVSELCLGTMTFGRKGFWKVMGGVPQEEVIQIV